LCFGLGAGGGVSGCGSATAGGGGGGGEGHRKEKRPPHIPSWENDGTPLTSKTDSASPTDKKTLCGILCLPYYLLFYTRKILARQIGTGT